MRTGDDVVDVAVIGAGINGAAVSHALAAAGYTVTLIERGDIGGGTSQASTMLIWGGLLYLKDFEIRTVRALCRDRDRLLVEAPDQARPCEVRHVATGHARPAPLIAAALHAYWALANGRRTRARRLTSFGEQALLRDRTARAFAFEEGTLVESDARFVLDLVRRAEALGAAVRTRTAVEGIGPHAAGSSRLALRDTLTDAPSTLDARLVVNAAGGWADTVNAAAGIATPWRHVLSRGVSLALPREAAHDTHLVFDTADGNALTLAPWGPVAVWASTESLHATMDEAGRIDATDVTGLLETYNAHFAAGRGVDDVVSLRIGVRPVPVARDRAVDTRGLGLSRHHRLHLDRERPWLTVFGGKLSGSRGLAAEVRALLATRLTPSRARPRPSTPPVGPRDATFPGLPGAWVAPAWAAAHEHCRTLDDYLRRRTAIAQWLPRGGFGRRDEHYAAVEAIARALHPHDAGAAARDLADYRRRVDADAQILQAARQLASCASLGVPA